MKQKSKTSILEFGTGFSINLENELDVGNADEVLMPLTVPAEVSTRAVQSAVDRCNESQKDFYLTLRVLLPEAARFTTANLIRKYQLICRRQS